ncbi:MAG TPA: class I SAM-dependent methyltransferase [Candidatus Binatia bacterium]|nr:class I SAM-dependent methyltransferase [Candidatus Binatia bacterium]
MSRLDSFIRRLEAQRACLGEAAKLVKDLDGVVLELGLGNGRTYDHLREICSDREIYVFDRQVLAHPSCIPPADHLFLGEITDTLAQALAKLGPRAALVHTDVGTGDQAANERLAATIAPMIRALMRPGGIVISDQPMIAPGLATVPLPEGVKPGRYFMTKAVERS